MKHVTLRPGAHRKDNIRICDFVCLLSLHLGYPMPRRQFCILLSVLHFGFFQATTLYIHRLY